LIVALISYFVHKTKIAGRKILDFLGFAPIAIPSVVLGATFFWFYLLVPLPLIGTLASSGSLISRNTCRWRCASYLPR
ncbi:MAG TPA: hypothetical protein VK148_23645, partial [Xanthobacteraceae bacterium]|nr:hypothetical protein [Xanthobacteraceae bacterium]